MDSAKPELKTIPAMHRSPQAMNTLQTRSFVDTDHGISLPYRLHVPEVCQGGTRCGLLLFLHGAGQRGCDNQAQLDHHALAFVADAAQARHPTIVVYPQCPDAMQWVNAPWGEGRYDLATTALSRPLGAALRLLASLQDELPVHPDRVLVTGLSMGGYGTWDALVREPHRFAAALPVCGGGDPTRAASIMHVPIWAFHGDADPTVPVRGSRQMIQALQTLGGRPRYTEIPGGGHDAWNHAYGDGPAVAWLLSQKRTPQSV
jgi:predicted peptidase